VVLTRSEEALGNEEERRNWSWAGLRSFETVLVFCGVENLLRRNELNEGELAWSEEVDWEVARGFSWMIMSPGQS